MNNPQSDGVDEHINGAIMMMVTIATRLGEQLIRHREQTLRTAQAISDKNARDAQARFNAERLATRSLLNPALTPGWLVKQDAEKLGSLLTESTAWAAHDDIAREVRPLIVEEVKQRWGVNANALGPDTPEVIQGVESGLRARAEAERERAQAAEDLAEAQAFLSSASLYDEMAAENHRLAEELAQEISYDDPTDQDVQFFERAEENRAAAELNAEKAAEHKVSAAEKFDSAERRNALAADLESRSVDPAVIHARIISDRDQAKPATAAVQGTKGKSPKARKTKTAVRDNSRQSQSR